MNNDVEEEKFGLISLFPLLFIYFCFLTIGVCSFDCLVGRYKLAFVKRNELTSQVTVPRSKIVENFMYYLN